MLNKFIIPVVVLFIVLYGFKKRVNLYDSFISGAGDGLKTILKIVPPIFGLILAVNIFVSSGFIDKVFSFFNAELVTLGVLRPISGNASLAMLNNIYQKYGVDSFSGFLGSIMQGATDTTIYILALYFSSVKIVKSRYALAVGLFADVGGIVAAVIVAKVFY